MADDYVENDREMKRFDAGDQLQTNCDSAHSLQNLFQNDIFPYPSTT